MVALKLYLEKLNNNQYYLDGGATTGEAPAPLEDSLSISSQLRDQKNSFMSQGQPALSESILSIDVV